MCERAVRPPHIVLALRSTFPAQTATILARSSVLTGQYPGNDAQEDAIGYCE